MKPGYDSLIAPYGTGDIARIPARDDMQPMANDMVASFGPNGPDHDATWSLTRRGHSEIAACGGYIRDHMGVYSLWGYCGADLTRREWVMIAHRIRGLIADLFGLGAHRIHAAARADHDAAVTFLIHVGLRHDMNRLVAMAPDGGDYILLAALKGFES